MELILSWITAMSFTAAGVLLFLYDVNTVAWFLLGTGGSILTAVLGLNLVYNTIPTWKHRLQEKKENLVIRMKQFEQKDGFIQTLREATPTDKEEISDFVTKVKESPFVKKLVDNLKKLDVPPKD